MASVELERIVQFADELLGTRGFPDYPPALNGLQVENSGRISRIAAAVDAGEASIVGARQLGADLLIVHHGLFWGGLRPVVGPLYRKASALLASDMALYSAHLPLDAHPDLGNCAILARELGIEIQGPFGSYKGAWVGWWGTVGSRRSDLLDQLRRAVGPEARVIEGGPEEVARVAVVTGGGASFLPEAAEEGMDSLVTGEAPHHAFNDTLELGVNLFLGGHYATETWGVRALAQRISQEFDVPWDFVDVPSGL